MARLRRTTKRITTAERGAWSLSLTVCVATASAACGRGTTPKPSSLLREELTGLSDDSVMRMTAGDTMRVGETTVRFYGRRRGAPAWVDGDGLSDMGEKAYATLEGSPVDGLSAGRYGVGQIRDIRRRLHAGDVQDSTRARLLAELDLALTEGLRRYATELSRGARDPRKSDVDWQIPRPPAPGVALLDSLASAPDPSEVIALLRPRTPYYGRLMAALRRFREIEARGGWPRVARGPSALAAGDSSPVVATLRARLAAGDDARESALALHGAARPFVFDAHLRKALEHFQDRNGIDDDGTLGQKTLKALNRSVEDRIADLQLNMDRWRWLPRRLGRRFLLVNVAGFELNVVENDQPVEAMNVVVGKQGWNTPIFADTMEYLIVNPYWNVPSSIAEAEILPKLERDPDYLRRNDFEVMRSGHPVSPASVDFAHAENYRFRQRPGPRNALGQLKFMFPNDDNIYFHDTPADHLFSLQERAFSHGCIRLERPKQLARLLMREVTDRPPASLDSLLAEKHEQWIRFEHGVPVYILYFTAWAEPDGTVRFYHDVYGRDRELERQALTAGVDSRRWRRRGCRFSGSFAPVSCAALSLSLS